MRGAAAGLGVLLMSVFTSAALAHPIGFGVAEWAQEGTAGTLSLRLPPRSLGSEELRALLPEGCEDIELSRLPDPNVIMLRWTATCPEGAFGTLGFARLPPELEVRLVDAQRARSYRLHARAPSVELNSSSGGGYFRLGVEHILTGWDHLLFVLGLLLLTGFNRRLLGVVSAFTLGHSLTLAAATFGWVGADPFILEALIAASIVLLGRELLRDTKGWTHRWPFAVALGFGLLHGLGFAGALAAIGLPQNERLLGLFAFNLGAEAGQLAFVACAGAVLALAARRMTSPLGTASSSDTASSPTPQAPTVGMTRLSRGLSYLVGTGGAYALLLRLL